jgi:hypothetical protein
LAAGEARVIDIQVSGTDGDSYFEDINYMQAAVFDRLQRKLTTNHHGASGAILGCHRTTYGRKM